MTTSEMQNEERMSRSIFNRVMMRMSGLLGLTTGIGVVAWGAWSMLITVGISIYERTGMEIDQIVIEDAFNQGLLQSAMLIALGAIILELRRIGDTLRSARGDD